MLFLFLYFIQNGTTNKLSYTDSSKIVTKRICRYKYKNPILMAKRAISTKSLPLIDVTSIYIHAH